MNPVRLRWAISRITFPASARNRGGGAPTAQQVLDMALAFAVINRHLNVSDFLLEHGADIDTTWSSHEPASILHELVFQGNYESMRFLIDRGIDMNIKDYRWNATAHGWALYAAKDQKMAQWLAEAQREREKGSRRASGRLACELFRNSLRCMVYLILAFSFSNSNLETFSSNLLTSSMSCI
jgi:hypothetical protein